MSKRRRKKQQPNLPEDVLARARRQAGIEDDEANANDEAEDAPAESSVVERAARRRKLTPVQLERNRKHGDLSQDYIRDILENPTEFVSEEQLREEYQHVLFDLRNMGLLAAALMVLLVLLAQLI
jgi:hypothetical protein